VLHIRFGDTSALLGESHKRIEAIMTESTRALIY